METYTWWHIEANTRTKAHHTHKAQATYITTTHRQWTMQKKNVVWHWSLGKNGCRRKKWKWKLSKTKPKHAEYASSYLFFLRSFRACCFRSINVEHASARRRQTSSLVSFIVAEVCCRSSTSNGASASFLPQQQFHQRRDFYLGLFS